MHTNVFGGQSNHLTIILPQILYIFTFFSFLLGTHPPFVTALLHYTPALCELLLLPLLLQNPT